MDYCCIYFNFQLNVTISYSVFSDCPNPVLTLYEMTILKTIFFCRCNHYTKLCLAESCKYKLLIPRIVCFAKKVLLRSLSR